jgi:hypothetical protein
MPDLSHRPTRYVTFALTAVAVAAGSANALDIGIGTGHDVAAVKKENEQLRAQMRALLAQQREATASTLAASRASAHTSAVRAAAAASASRSRSAQLNCGTFPDQAAAQRAWLAHPAARAALDGDRDGRACEQLKTAGLPITTRVVAGPPHVVRLQAAPVRPALQVLPKVPSKAQIVASGRHFGLATETTEESDSLQRSVGRNATLQGFYEGWNAGYDRNRVISSWRRGQVPVMTWESRDLSATSKTDYSLRRIINGSFDAYLTKYARDVKQLGLPLVIRFDHEMNGNWYRWSEFEDKPYDNKVGEYAAAWRHVHDVFEAQGANQHVVWLWSPNRVDNLGRYPAIDGYYPGDRYVDWVGMTGYFRPGDKVATFSGTYDKTLAELRRVAPRKPILLAEVGATDTGAKKAAWATSFFAGLQRNPDVAGFIWFNYAVTDMNETTTGVTNDWRINSTPQVRQAVAAGLKASGYGREPGKRAVLVPRAAAALTAVPALRTPAPAPLPGPTGVTVTAVPVSREPESRIRSTRPAAPTDTATASGTSVTVTPPPGGSRVARALSSAGASS